MASPFQINAALNGLVDENCHEWIHLAEIVINEFRELKKASPVSVEVVGRIEKKDAEMTGTTPDKGNLTINTDETRDIDWSSGIKKERVGHFRLYKEQEGIIAFHKFWRSDMATEPDEEKHPPLYRLHYDAKSFAPIKVVTSSEKPAFRFLFIHLIGEYEVPIHTLDGSKEPKRVGISIVLGN